MSETRLLFYSDGLALAGITAAAAGALIFWGLLVHWLVRSSRWRMAPLLIVPPILALVAWLQSRRPRDGTSPESDEPAVEPILPWWQILVGFALAVALFPAAVAAARTPKPPIQLALMGLLAASASAWVLFFYLRAYQYLGRLPMGILTAMRIAAICLLVLLIFKPILSFREHVRHRTNLAVLVDASRSMSVSDWPDTPHRLAQATTQLEEYLDRLEAAFDVKLYAFDTHAREVTGGEWPEPEGDATNLTRALRDVLAATRRADTSALVVMTDGLYNAGGDPVEAISRVGPPPIYPVGVGTDLTAQSGYQDISLADIRAPEEAVAGNIAKITVDVEATGLADRSVQVLLREGETLLASEPLRLDAAPGSQSVTLTVTPAETGRHTYTVEIPPDPAERRAENNTRDVYLLVTDPKIRVLYIEGVVRPEYKPLKSVLETDPNVELLALVQVSQGEFLQSGNLTGLALSGFPQTLDDMRKFDVFIIGDLDRSYFSARHLENLKTAVSEGRGLVMIGGYNSFGPGGYEDTPMEEMLPVRVGPRSMGQETIAFVMKLTPEGENHPILFGTRDFFAAPGKAAPREQLPHLKGCSRLGRAKPGASVLAVHPERAGPDGPLVVLAVQPWGEGRTAAFAADTTYQWYLPFKALGLDSPYVKFWGQMVRWLANKEIKEQAAEPGVTLLVRKPHYMPGEKVAVRVKVRAEEGRATNFADVTGAVVQPDDKRVTLNLALAPGETGVYEAEFAPADPGEYKLLVEARKDGARIGLAEDSFQVGRPNQEFDRLSIDRTVLQGLARATGGEYYEPAAFGDLVETLRSRTIAEDIHRELGVQTVPGLFGVLFAVFLTIVTAEWILRKYYQLN
ncbi:MAG TPA: glutamine amidotransferase [Phycisphaerae bacterium]|nr:glutamine amidotransferase [Phycisphaerae bacterium]